MWKTSLYPLLSVVLTELSDIFVGTVLPIKCVGNVKSETAAFLAL